MPRGHKGEPRTPGAGRKKGTPNKVTRDMREIVRTAFEKAGGVDYLLIQSKENPTAFLTLLGKIIPAELNLGGQPDNPVITLTREEITKKSQTLMQKAEDRIKLLRHESILPE